MVTDAYDRGRLLHFAQGVYNFRKSTEIWNSFWKYWKSLGI